MSQGHPPPDVGSYLRSPSGIIYRVAGYDPEDPSIVNLQFRSTYQAGALWIGPYAFATRDLAGPKPSFQVVVFELVTCI